MICVNAFSTCLHKNGFTKLMRAARHRVIIRSYFTESTYRIVRAQTTRNHDKSQVDELAAFDDAGNILCYDFWNMYSFTYMEALVRTIEPKARAEWIEDKNVLSSLEEERKLNLQNAAPELPRLPRGVLSFYIALEISVYRRERRLTRAPCKLPAPILMPLPLSTDRLTIERFGQTHRDDPNYLQWLSDKENLVSLNLVDYQLKPVTQEKLAAYYRSFADNPHNLLFAGSTGNQKVYRHRDAPRDRSWRAARSSAS